MTPPSYDNSDDIFESYDGSNMCGDGCLHGIVYTADNPKSPFFYKLQGICWDPATKTLHKAKEIFADCLGYQLSSDADVDVYLESDTTACFTSNLFFSSFLL